MFLTGHFTTVLGVVVEPLRCRRCECGELGLFCCGHVDTRGSVIWNKFGRIRRCYQGLRSNQVASLVIDRDLRDHVDTRGSVICNKAGRIGRCYQGLRSNHGASRVIERGLCDVCFVQCFGLPSATLRWTNDQVCICDRFCVEGRL